MTRKKFIKLLMSDGFSRNEANGIAARCIVSKVSYETYYKYRYPAIKTLKKWKLIINCVNETIKENLSNLATAFDNLKSCLAERQGTTQCER